MNIFCITSTINVSEKPWNYTLKRSYWSSEERFEQTIKQIYSIRNFCEDSFIILSEGSILTEEQKNKIIPLVDIFLNDITNPIVYNAIHNTDLKGPGEIYELLFALDYIKNNNLKYKRIFKITGRYSLNKNFNLDNYSLDKLSFQHIKQVNKYNTILYSIPVNELIFFYDSIQYMLHDNDIYNGLESIYTKYFRNIQNIDILGAEGYMGISDYYNTI